MQVGQNDGQKTGPPHHKRRKITIATSEAVDASWPKFRPQKRAHRTTRKEEEQSQRAMMFMQFCQHFGQKNGPTAPQDKNKHNRNDQGC